MTNQNKVLSRSEPKVIRPFVGLDAIENSLQSARVFINGEHFGPGNIVLPRAQLDEIQLALEPGFQITEVIKALDHALIPEVDVAFVIWAQSISLKETQVLYLRGLREQESFDSFDVTSVIRERISADYEGFDLYLAFILHASHNPAPLKPTKVGTWLAKQKYRIRPERFDSSFAPQELTDEIRAQYDLPKNTLSYISVVEDSIIGAEDLGAQVICYVTGDVLTQMQQDPKSKVSRLIQTTLATEIITTLLTHIAKELSDGSQIISDSMLSQISPEAGAGKLLAKISRKWQEKPILEILNIALNDNQKLKSIVASNLDAKSDSLSALSSQTLEQGN